jgi:hypothetical protein
MRPEDSDERPAPPPRRPGHREERKSWPTPSRHRGTSPPRSSKTMHLPATRIGEIKHGKS